MQRGWECTSPTPSRLALLCPAYPLPALGEAHRIRCCRAKGEPLYRHLRGTDDVMGGHEYGPQGLPGERVWRSWEASGGHSGVRAPTWTCQWKAVMEAAEHGVEGMHEAAHAAGCIACGDRLDGCSCVNTWQVAHATSVAYVGYCGTRMHRFDMHRVVYCNGSYSADRRGSKTAKARPPQSEGPRNSEHSLSARNCQHEPCTCRMVWTRCFWKICETVLVTS